MKLAIAGLLALVCLAACHKKKVVYRPLETGVFAGYKIEDCATGGHVVKLATPPDERGEAASRERVDNYKKQYLVPALGKAIDVGGWAYDNTCAASGLTLKTKAAQAGEALHRIGETLKKNPTDIEVVVVPDT